MKFFKPGKVVIMLNGRYAGKKAVIVNVVSRKTKTRKFHHCIVAGLLKYPKKITREMSLHRIKKRSRLIPFVKVVNLAHVLPTRYSTDINLEKVATPEKIGQPAQRFKVRHAVARIFAKKYRTGENRWFFEKLRF